MANTVNKHLNIFVNGKQVENNIKSIRAAMAQLINEQAKMTVGSDEYVAHSEKIKQLKGIYEEHRKELKLTTDVIEKATDKSKGLLDKAAIVGIGKVSYEVVQQIKSSISEYVEAFATLDDAMAAVRKTTGMTTEEVDQLKESLKNIDTRTATNELLKIAEHSGRLGIAKEDIKALRLEKSLPIINLIGKYIYQEHTEGLPQSPIGKAFDYYSDRHTTLSNYLCNGNLNIDNNLIENAIRPLALGRKNYLFAGSHERAEDIAMYYSFFATCRLNEVNPEEWLTFVLGHITDAKPSQ